MFYVTRKCLESRRSPNSCTQATFSTAVGPWDSCSNRYNISCFPFSVNIYFKLNKWSVSVEYTEPVFKKGRVYKGIYCPTLTNSFREPSLELSYQRYSHRQRQKSLIIVNFVDMTLKAVLAGKRVFFAFSKPFFQTPPSTQQALNTKKKTRKKNHKLKRCLIKHIILYRTIKMFFLVAPR